MAGMGKHAIDETTPVAVPDATPGPRRDHLWVLAVIAVCVLAEVWASWVGVGALSGFPRLGRIPTDWVLAVAMEGLWAYALYAWLAASPGPRSRKMAMWTCAVVFALSLAGQVIYHEITAPPGTPLGRRFVIGFVTSLPVIVLALIAVLVHLRHEDRAEAEAVARAAAEAERAAVIERAEVDERASLRRELADVTARTAAEVTALRDTATGAQAEAEAARAEVEKLAGQVESLTRKLADARERQKAGSQGRKRAGTGSRNRPGNTAATGPGAASATGPEDAAVSGAEAPPSDLDAEATVLWHVSKGKSASEAGRLAGLSDSRGRQIVRELAKTAPQGFEADHAEEG